MTMASAGAEHRRRSSSSNPKEKFPELDRSQSGDYLTTYDDQDEGTTLSRTPSPARAHGNIRNERWQPRKDNHLVWGNGHLNVAGPRGHGHIRQKSLSDAFRTIRNRRASVSENAHEIAEALKAPISVRTIVCELLETDGLPELNDDLGPLPRLVLEFRLDQYLVEIYIECVPQTDYSDYHTIRLRLRLVPFFGIPCTLIPTSQDHNTRSKERYQISWSRRYSYDHAARAFSDWRSYTFLHSHREDPCISRPHHQRTLSAIYRSRLPLHIQHPLPDGNIPLVDTPHCRGYLSL